MERLKGRNLCSVNWLTAIDMDQWEGEIQRGTGIIWSILPNYVSFDGEFYDNDSPNMSNVPQAGSDLTVDLSSPIYFIPQRAFTEAKLLPSNFLSLLSLNLWCWKFSVFCRKGFDKSYCGGWLRTPSKSAKKPMQNCQQKYKSRFSLVTLILQQNQGKTLSCATDIYLKYKQKLKFYSD